MSHTRILAALALAVGPAARAGTPESDVLDALVKASAVPPEIHFESGFPRYVGVDVAESGADATERALAFLTAFAGLYGLVDPSTELVVDRVRDDGTLADVGLRQLHDGLPVEGGQLTVHLGKDRVLWVGGHLVTGLGPAPAATVSRAEAERIALDASGLSEPYTLVPARRVVVGASSRIGGVVARPAWRAEVGGPDTLREILVDAGDGAILGDRERVQRDFDLQVETAFETFNSPPWCWNAVWEDAATWFDEDGPTDDFDPSLDTFDDAADGADQGAEIWSWWEDTFGRDSYDDDGGEIHLMTHVSPFPAAGYVPHCGMIEYQDGLVQRDVTAHEFTHWVAGCGADFDSDGQPGALNESFADVFAALLDDDDPTIGETIEGIDLPGCNDGPALRDLSDAPRCGQPDHMLATLSGDGVGFQPIPAVGAVCDITQPTFNDCGFVHANDGIPNTAAWLLMEGGTHAGYDVQAIGRTKVGRLYHDVLLYGLDSDATFTDARDALVGTANVYRQFGAYGFDDDDVCAVRNAFASVGISIGGADTDCDGAPDVTEADDDGDYVPDDEDNCPHEVNGSQYDGDGDGLGDACDDDTDGDGKPDAKDNCPNVSNSDQADADGDGTGDVCDDSDGDQVDDPVDNCPKNANGDQADTDGDGTGDVCDGDDDGDGVGDRFDDCALTANADQADQDKDGVGDACDNCVDVSNADQQDCDGNGVGTACDTSLGEMVYGPGCSQPHLPVLAAAYVSPLDLVSIPIPDGLTTHVDASTDDGTPVRVIDDRGTVIGEVDAKAGLTFTARPTALTGIRGYYLQIGPSLDAELKVDVAIDAGP